MCYLQKDGDVNYLSLLVRTCNDSVRVLTAVHMWLVFGVCSVTAYSTSTLIFVPIFRVVETVSPHTIPCSWIFHEAMSSDISNQ